MPVSAASQKNVVLWFLGCRNNKLHFVASEESLFLLVALREHQAVETGYARRTAMPCLSSTSFAALHSVLDRFPCSHGLGYPARLNKPPVTPS
jgi:hypothetical protein